MMTGSPIGEQTQRFRLLTRSDFDGLVSSVLLRQLELVDEIKFVHPKDMQDGLIPVSRSDITTNLPFVQGVHMAFDHHESELRRVGGNECLVLDATAPSASRVVYDHFGGKERFPTVPEQMLIAVDKGDSARFEKEEILHPQGWNLLNFITDARTGLGRFKNFRISNQELMMDLIEYCMQYSVDEILAISDVAERVALYFEHEPLFQQQLRASADIRGNVLINDLRRFDTIYAGNRFVKYALFPETDISVQIMWGFQKQNTVITVGKSIFDRSSPVNVGALMLKYRGGGHEATGTCQVNNEDADAALSDIVASVQHQKNGDETTG